MFTQKNKIFNEFAHIFHLCFSCVVTEPKKKIPKTKKNLIKSENYVYLVFFSYLWYRYTIRSSKIVYILCGQVCAKN